MYMMTVRLPHDYVWCCIVACEELRQHCCVLANFIYQLLLCVSRVINCIFDIITNDWLNVTMFAVYCHS